jgi:hypothetical protein
MITVKRHKMRNDVTSLSSVPPPPSAPPFHIATSQHAALFAATLTSHNLHTVQACHLLLLGPGRFEHLTHYAHHTTKPHTQHNPQTAHRTGTCSGLGRVAVSSTAYLCACARARELGKVRYFELNADVSECENSSLTDGL